MFLLGDASRHGAYAVQGTEEKEKGGDPYYHEIRGAEYRCSGVITFGLLSAFWTRGLHGTNDWDARRMDQLASGVLFFLCEACVTGSRGCRGSAELPLVMSLDAGGPGPGGDTERAQTWLLGDGEAGRAQSSFSYA